MLASVRRHGEIRFGPDVLKGQYDPLAREDNAEQFRDFYNTVAIHEYSPSANTVTQIINHPYVNEFYAEPKDVSRKLLEDYLLKQGQHFYP